MVTYIYKHCGTTKEIVQSINKKLTAPKCMVCNDNMIREYDTFAIKFKGDGFYANNKYKS